MKLDITHLARLAYLRFAPEEMSKFEGEMQAIVDMMAGLPAADGEYSTLDPDNPMALRPDTPSASLDRQELLAGAPSAQAGCFLIPRTVE